MDSRSHTTFYRTKRPTCTSRTYVHFLKARPPSAYPVAEDAVSQGSYDIPDVIHLGVVTASKALLENVVLFVKGSWCSLSSMATHLTRSFALVEPKIVQPARLSPGVHQATAEGLEQVPLDKVSVGRVGAVRNDMAPRM